MNVNMNMKVIGGPAARRHGTIISSPDLVQLNHQFSTLAARLATFEVATWVCLHAIQAVFAAENSHYPSF